MSKLIFTLLCVFPISFFPGQQNTEAPAPPKPWEEWQLEMVRLVNNIRKEGCRCGSKKMRPAKPLKWNNALATAALLHAKDMEKNHFIGHYGTNGSRIGQRVDRAGYNWRVVAENVAWNAQSIHGAVYGWKESPSHCINMMGGYTEMGAAQVGQYWVQVFASPMK